MVRTSDSSPQESGILRAFDEQCINEIIPFSQRMSYKKDEVILVKGSGSRSLYYVEQGAVEVSHFVQETKIVVALIGVGNFFGEIGFFDGISRIRDIRATEDTVIRTFDQDSILKLQQDNPALYSRFVTLLAQFICARFRRVLEEREPLTAYAASLSTGRKSYEEAKPLPERFFQTPEWVSINKIVEEFKAQIFDLSYRLQRDSNPVPNGDLNERCHNVMDEFNDRLLEFEKLYHGAEGEAYSWGYVFKETFPYLMRSRFMERAYYKPRGYPGDYMMMEMIYRNQPEGDGSLGTLIDRWCLNATPAKAVRGRRRLLSEQLLLYCSKYLGTGVPIRIMNLACGPTRELFDFFSDFQSTESIHATCVDADPHALAYTDQQVNVGPHRATVRLVNDNVVKWSLGAIRHEYGLQDIIYSAGLTDYLDRQLCEALIERCHEHLKPGGVLIVGNFGPKNRNRVMMDHLLNWRLIYRDQSDLEQLFLRTSFGTNLRILSEEEGVNLFAVAMKQN